MNRRWVVVVATAVALVAGACSGSDGDTATTTTERRATTTTEAPFACDVPAAGHRTVTVGGEARSYELALPERFERAAPVVVLFHGYTSTAAEIEEVTGLADTGPAAGVVVVAPQAVGNPSSWRIVDGLDADAAFVDRILADLDATGCVDPQQVWLAGFSAGSAFSGVYGCSRKAPVAGLVLVSGLPPAICPEDHTPRVLIVNGTADPVVPFAGGDQNVNGQMVPLASIPESSAGWAARAGCTGAPEDHPVGADVELSSWGECERGGPVDLVAVTGGGHTWPGGSGTPIGGVTSQSVSTSCLVLGLVADPEAALAPLADRCPGDHPASGG